MGFKERYQATKEKIKAWDEKRNERVEESRAKAKKFSKATVKNIKKFNQHLDESAEKRREKKLKNYEYQASVEEQKAKIRKYQSRGVSRTTHAPQSSGFSIGSSNQDYFSGGVTGGNMFGSPAPVTRKPTPRRRVTRRRVTRRKPTTKRRTTKRRVTRRRRTRKPAQKESYNIFGNL